MKDIYMNEIPYIQSMYSRTLTATALSKYQS